MTLTIWHNPRCSKSRQTLALMHERGTDPEIRLYLSDGPTRAEIVAVLAALGCPAIDLVRTGEKLFAELGLSKTDPADLLIDATAAHPILIERPLVINGTRAALGRPPENALTVI